MSLSRERKVDDSKSVPVNTSNFYFNGLNNSPILKESTDQAFKFIVLQNDALHLKNTNLLLEVEQSKSKIDELESSSDQMERDKIVMKGYLNNLVILTGLYRDLCKINKKSSDFYRQKNREKELRKYIHFTLLILSIISLFYSMLFVCICLFCDFIVYVYGRRYNTADVFAENIVMADAQKKKKEIQEILKGNGLLEQLLSNL